LARANLDDCVRWRRRSRHWGYPIDRWELYATYVSGNAERASSSACAQLVLDARAEDRHQGKPGDKLRTTLHIVTAWRAAHSTAGARAVDGAGTTHGKNVRLGAANANERSCG